GLPEAGVVQANIAVAPSDPKRLFASVASPREVGIYRSDDAGESWTRATTDSRPAGRIGGGDLPVPHVNPKNPDIVFVTSTVTWKSTDGGKTWTGFRGAPGGDDYQNGWINPDNPDIILLASDQGAIITVNGGQSWSSWYNQPTAQMYHVSADNAFPYRVCSGQQESGSACVSSRGNDGQITFRDWHPVGADEYSYVAADPLDPDIIYGGKATRYDRRTGQVQNISPKPIRGPEFRLLRTEPVLFSPVDPRILFFAGNTLWKTRDGGQSWQQISPDLTRKTWDVPASVGKYRGAETAKPTQRGVIYTVAPSPLDINRIWAGTDDGLIHVTVDGGLHWRDVTPPQLTPWAKVSIIDAGHFDALTAYAAINTLRLDDLRPHIYRTHDGGRTWTHIANGIPDGGTVNVVREDPKRKGLLFAGTEREVYVSFDDGDHWQSLRLNMAPSSVRDVIIKDDDLVAGTHGRGFWILDDITPLRQIDAKAAAADAVLFKPQVAYRVRWNTNTDTPLPPDEPAGANPPDGAIINYALKSTASGPVTLEILDHAGKLVRRYSSADPVVPIDPMLNIPTYWVRPPQALSNAAAYWVRPPQALSNAAGMHRFLWDMHYPPVPGGRANYPISAVVHNTAPATSSPWAMPGQYTVKLTVCANVGAGLSPAPSSDCKTYSQPLTVKMDPRVKTPLLGLQQQFTLSKQLYDDSAAAASAIEQIRSLRAQLQKAKDGAGAPAEAIAALDKKSSELMGSGGGGFGGGGAAALAADSLTSVRAALQSLMGILQGADVTPTTQAVAAITDRRKALAALMAKWSEMKAKDLPAVNEQLRKANLPELKLE
ncbi:MAG: glycoside hydrolase, partial [Candidatus Koribacter versatilis]|nr:glycoside hydrolase [Candidatus Koribacter versatilis]